jgi:uncharacterized surface protein with fasciclin (FAS1) repeats
MATVRSSSWLCSTLVGLCSSSVGPCSGQVLLNKKSEVLFVDVECKNGVIHVISDVIMPPPPKEGK